LPDEADERFKKLIDALARNWPAFLGGISAIASGAWMMLDDAKDFGKFETPTHKSPVHHWWLGALVLAAGAAGVCFTLLHILSELPVPQPENLEKVRRIFEQHGKPVEQVLKELGVS